MLISHQGRHLAGRFDPALWPAPLCLLRRCNPSLFDQLVQESGPIDRNDPGDGSSVIGDGDHSATADLVEIAAELVPKLSYSDFWHRLFLMAIFVRDIVAIFSGGGKGLIGSSDDSSIPLSGPHRSRRGAGSRWVGGPRMVATALGVRDGDEGHHQPQPGGIG